MARHKFVASTRVSEEDPEDVPASVIRRPPKNRAGRASGFDHASADRRKDSESSLSSVPPDGSAADRRTRLPRATKEVVYKNPPWGDKNKGDRPLQGDNALPIGDKGKPRAKSKTSQRNTHQGPRDDHIDSDDDDMDVDDQSKEGSAGTGKRKRAESASGDLEASSTSQSQRPHRTGKKVKKDGPASGHDNASRGQPVDANKATRSHAAPRIDVDASSSDEEQAQAAVLPPKFARKKVLANAELREQTLNDQGEDPQDDAADRSASEEPEDHNMDASMDLAAEAVIFTKTTSRARSEDPDPCDNNEEGDLARRLTSRRKAAPHIRMSSESSSSTNNDAPPTSDMSDVDEPDPARDAAASSTHHHRRHSQTAKKGTTMKKRDLKLKEEMPVLSGAKQLKKKRSAVSLADLDNGAKLPWLSRTDITSALRQISKNTWEITISNLNPVMAEVVRTAIKVGAVALELGPYNLKLPDEGADNVESDGSDSDSQTKDDWGERLHVVKYTPFEAHGLHQYGVDALIKAAEDLKLDGELDVAHRMELGSMPLYIKPLSNYVAGRLRSYRGAIKTAAIQCLPGALRLPDGPDRTRERTREELTMLLKDVNFLYPQNLRTGKFDRSKPFSGAGIRDIIKAAFFIQKQWLNVGISNIGRFRSSYKFARDEPEVTPSMLALAATALEAALTDMVNGSDSDFAGITPHGAYKDHLGTALDFRQRKPLNYHKLTHDLLVYASNGAVKHTTSLSVAEGSTGRLRRAAIDWDAIVEPE